MPKYIVRWNVGYGDEFDIIEADSMKEAEECAFEAYQANMYSDYGAEEYTEEKAIEYGLTGENI